MWKVLCFVALLCCASATLVQREKNRELSRSQARVNAGITVWMSYNYGFANTFKDAGIKAKIFTEKDWPAIGKVLAIRGARMEAAIGVAAQSQTNMLQALKTTINNIICAVKLAFPNEGEEVVLGRLFALPGKATAAAENAWLAATDKDGKHPPKWIDFDKSRSGCFLSMTDGIAAHIQNVKRVLASGNYRELLHLLARMSLYGEFDSITTPEICEKQAPGSFRHAMIRLYKNPNIVTAAANSCKFDVAHLKLKWSFWGQGKGLLQPTAKSSVNDARGKNAAFRGKRSPPVNNGKSELNAFSIQGLGMPAVSAQETNFFRQHGQQGRSLTWTTGGNFLKVPRNDVNAPWFDAMVQDGLMIDAGPSGTTDEAFQFADFAGVSKTKDGACNFRDALFANMIIQMHHSFPEIAQGASDSKRASPAWDFAHPYATLESCGGELYAKALKRYKQLSQPGGLSAFVQSSDFGKMGPGPRTNDGYPLFPNRVFLPSDEGAAAQIFNDLVCNKGRKKNPNFWAKELKDIYCA